MKKTLYIIALLMVNIPTTSIKAVDTSLLNDLSAGYNSAGDNSSQLPESSTLLNSGMTMFDEKIMFKTLINRETAQHKIMGSFEIIRDESWGKSAIAGIGYGYEKNNSQKEIFTLPQEIWFYRSWNKDCYYRFTKWHSGLGAKVGWDDDIHIIIDAPDIIDSVFRNFHNDITGYSIDMALGWKEFFPILLRVYGYSKEISKYYPDRKMFNTIDNYSCHAQYYGEKINFSFGYTLYRKEIHEENTPNSDIKFYNVLEKRIFHGIGLTLNLKVFNERIQPYCEAHILKGTKDASGEMFIGKFGTKVSF
jgi:hypothetical protein